jgi:hypothetical protein
MSGASDAELSFAFPGLRRYVSNEPVAKAASIRSFCLVSSTITHAAEYDGIDFWQTKFVFRKCYDRRLYLLLDCKTA